MTERQQLVKDLSNSIASLQTRIDKHPDNAALLLKWQNNDRRSLYRLLPDLFPEYKNI